MGSDNEVLSDLNVSIGDAETEGNKTFFEERLAPKLAFRRANGDFDDRETFLGKVKPSTPRETEIESIKLLGRDRAVVTCTVPLDSDGQRKTFHNVRLFVRTPDGEWKLLGWANEQV